MIFITFFASFCFSVTKILNITHSTLNNQINLPMCKIFSIFAPENETQQTIPPYF